MITPESVTIAIDGPGLSPACGRRPAARACLVLAHGAGAGMTHRSMAAIADGLAERGVATLRYQFPLWSADRSGLTDRRSPTPRRRGGSARDRG